MQITYMREEMRRSTGKRLLAVGILVSSVVLGACGGEEEARQKSEKGREAGGGRQWGGRAGAGSTAAIPVKTEPVERGDVALYVQTHARLEAERWVSVVAWVQGMVTELAVEEGDRVAEGDVLARLNKEELALKVEQAEVVLEQAASAYERTKALYERQLVSEEEYDAAWHQMKNIEVSLKEARINLDHADVLAPISGTVMQRLVEVGDVVRANDQVFAVADVDPLLARIHVPEKRMLQIRKGQEARITVDSVPDKTFVGRIRMISPGVDPQSGTVKVTLEIPAASGLLKPGMFAKVRIVTASHLRTLIIPKKALVLETDEDDIFVFSQGVARRVRIQPGFVDGDRVEVVAGLAEGDQVITVGHEGLKDGARVRLAGQVDHGGGEAGAPPMQGGRPDPAGGRDREAPGSAVVPPGGRAFPDSATFVRRAQEHRGLSESEAVERWKKVRNRFGNRNGND